MNSYVTKKSLSEEEPPDSGKKSCQDADEASGLDDGKKLKSNDNVTKEDRLKHAWVNWVCRHETDYFLTIHLKKAVANKIGICQYIQYDDIIYVSKWLRNNLTQKLTHRDGRINFFPFLEKSYSGDRYHLHILFSNPKQHSMEKIRSIIETCSNKNHWLYNEKKKLKKSNGLEEKMSDFDLRQVYYKRGLVNYCAKDSQYLLIVEAIGIKR